jgi:hypothetical protein
MRRNRLLISVLICLFLSFSCTQTLPPPPTSEPIAVIDGTPYENPMELIELFARQTAVAQTEAANPYRPSLFDLTQTPSEFSTATKILHVIFSYTSRVSYSLRDLESFPQVTVTVKDQEVKGIALLTFLERAGWDTYDAVAVSINGVGSLTIPRERIGEDFVLVVTGTSLRFISPSVPENMWIEGVTIIEVY